MNPIEPNAGPGGMEPNGDPKPWEKQQPQQADAAATDGGGIADAAGQVVEGAADVIGGVADTAGSAIEATGGCLGGCADGCGGCSAAVLIALFLTAQAAFAMFR
jgi:hypothetical protein